MTPDTQEVGDLVSFGVIVGVSQQWLPQLASVLAIVWTAIRIFDWCWRIYSQRRKDE